MLITVGEVESCELLSLFLLSVGYHVQCCTQLNVTWTLFYHFVADGIDLGLDALLALCVLVVQRKVEIQQVVQGAVVRGSISFLLAHILSADPLPSGQSVERAGLTGSGSAAEPLGTVGCVNPTGRSSLQSAGHAAAAPRLPQHLPAVCWDGRTVVEFLLRTGSTTDGLRAHYRGRPHHGQDS